MDDAGSDLRKTVNWKELYGDSMQDSREDPVT